MNAFALDPVLGIETSGTLTGAALVRRGRLVGESALDAKSMSQEVLLDQVDRLLRAQGLRPRDLARIGVALGPGSFTGLRVGLAAARAFAIGAEVPLVGVPSHEALAWPLRGLGRALVLLTGLRRGEVFLEVGEWESQTWRPRLAGASVPAERVPDLVRPLVAGWGRALYLGEAAAALIALHPELALFGDLIDDPLAALRRPAVIAVLAARRDLVELRGAGLDRLEPLYLRGADARRPGAIHGS